MSEYQYYEFLAVDSRLDARQMAELRSISSRATITSTGFRNEYAYGSLKAEPTELLARYFDVFVYVANWGTRQVAFRLPPDVVPSEAFSWAGSGDSVSVQQSGEAVIVDLTSESDDYWGWVDGSGWIASLAGVREALLHGDRRALYLMWLHSCRDMDVDEGAEEPHVPPGLGELPAPLAALVEFLRIDVHLVAAAAERSGSRSDDEGGMAECIASLSETEKNRLLMQVANGEHAQVVTWLVRRHRDAVRSESTDSAQPPRTRGALMDRADELRDAWEQQQKLAEEQERLERERVAAVERNLRLDALAQREAAAWQEVEDLIDSKQQSAYDDAIRLLVDLCALAIRSSKEHEADTKIEALRLRHARKPSFIRRLVNVGLA